MTQSAHVGCQRNRPHQGGPGPLLYVILPLKPLKITRTTTKKHLPCFQCRQSGLVNPGKEARESRHTHKEEIIIDHVSDTNCSKQQFNSLV